MELKATVRYRNEFAHYKIVNEGDQIYAARLEDYKGNVHNIPPTHIVLTKGIRHWVGSIDDEKLVNDIGEMIDLYCTIGIGNQEGGKNGPAEPGTGIV